VARCGGFLEGAVVDRNGRLWVTDVTGGRILEVRPGGNCIVRARTGGHPNGARLGPDGKVAIADWVGLLMFDPASLRLDRVSLRYGSEEITGLNDLCFDGSGGLYFTVPGKSDAFNPVGRLFYRSPQGAVRLISDKLAYPNGVAVLGDGQAVLVSDFAQKRIVSLPAVDATGSMQLAYVFAYPASGIGADGMLLASDGRLIVANFGSREVQLFGSDGRATAAIHLPADAGDWVTNIAAQGETLYITEARKGEVWRVQLPKR
jgi:gluconolactonase